jgi:hypothetical protein
MMLGKDKNIDDNQGLRQKECVRLFLRRSTNFAHKVICVLFAATFRRRFLNLVKP